MGASLSHDPAGLKEGKYMVSLCKKPAHLCYDCSKDHPSVCSVALLGTRHSSATPGHRTSVQKALSRTMGDRTLLCASGHFLLFNLGKFWSNSGEILTKSLSKLGKGNRKPQPHWFLRERTSGCPGKESVSGYVIYTRRD